MEIDFQSVSNGKTPQQPEVIQADGSLVIKTVESKAIIDAFLPKAELIRNQALAIKIKDDKTRVKASETGVRIKNLIKEINLAVETNIGQPKSFVDGIVNAGKKIKAELDRGKRYLADELLKDKQRQDLERAKQQEAIRKADKARQDALAKEAKKLNIATPVMPELVLPKTTKEEAQTRTDAGVSFARGRWTYELMDINQVPKEYLVQKENGSLINNKITQGLRDELDKDGKVTRAAIPGIRIYFKESIAFK